MAQGALSLWRPEYREPRRGTNRPTEPTVPSPSGLPPCADRRISGQTSLFLALGVLVVAIVCSAQPITSTLSRLIAFMVIVCGRIKFLAFGTETGDGNRDAISFTRGGNRGDENRDEAAARATLWYR